MNLSKPLLTLGYPFARTYAHVPAFAHSHVYTNPTCARTGCTNAHAPGETTYCAPCAALPSCDVCGEPSVDCDAHGTCSESASFNPCEDESCDTCDGFGRSYRMPDPDRERFGNE